MATIKSLIPNDFSYHISKLYNGTYTEYPLIEFNLESVQNACATLKTEIDNQYGLSSLTGASIVFDKIDYVLKKLEHWIKTKTIVGNLDAGVFLDAFKGYFDELKQMIDEMDSGQVQKR
ncbi:hypothetical protein HH214_15550 [Mucilaginibacter robiniae]|uniref:Uncharacterized protein n=1 Tax=Mucilaginibacter robiniae TaxID=2728022 RepID=A0A7L5E5Z0_9SPHI|nr:hypothetical protein [Mucilaginibacter robiniae]QJD97184.1 hypothetical protein HH214_15550 [Mucilaginibacter robiniae]